MICQTSGFLGEDIFDHCHILVQAIAIDITSINLKIDVFGNGIADGVANFREKRHIGTILDKFQLG